MPSIYSIGEETLGRQRSDYLNAKINAALGLGPQPEPLPDLLEATRRAQECKAHLAELRARRTEKMEDTAREEAEARHKTAEAARRRIARIARKIRKAH